MPSYLEQERDRLHAEWVKNSNQKRSACILLITAGVLFVDNAFASAESTNAVLGGVTLSGFIGGAVWLYLLRKEQRRISRRSDEVLKEIDASGGSPDPLPLSRASKPRGR